MIGHIQIIGLIGTQYNEKGEIIEKGVELEDVIEQVAEFPEGVDEVHVHINSQGGFVSVGNDIADFIGTLPNVKTFAENLCASIATKIHLVPPLQNRFIEEGCNYMIHNPFLQNVTGDAAKLTAAAESIKETEKELEATYSKATGLSKEALSGLMNLETELTPEKAVKFKFASEIIKKEQARAVALFYNKQETKMKKSFSQRAALALAVMTGKATATLEREAKALIIETNNGTLTTPFGDLAVGDSVEINGEIAPDGIYEVTGEGELMLVEGGSITQGATIEVLEGVITSINPEPVDAENKKEEQAKAEAIKAAKAKKESGEDLTEEEKALLEGDEEEEEEEEEDAQAKKIEQLESQLKAEREAKEKAEAKLQESENEKKEIVEQMEAKAGITSGWTPPKAQASFGNRGKKEEKLSIKEEAARRAEEYKKK